ncbi:bifunctional RNase H/acid phosphatase [Demetria terragena]|uniref:bifunctional RNase H/acid phosphatase n=1 Tax=Demetria terragena TaxID=63959 RepID=UPI000475FE54|nr:bifunctional RNase H/acid phosphatase [Demetria terragena]
MSRRRLRVEADGGSRGNPGVAGYGALVRDRDTGELLAERAEPLGKASNNVAEYSGLIAGLEAAAAVDASAEIDVRMDSKLVIEQMAGRWKIKHADMRRLALEARDIVQRIEDAGGSVEYGWIPREENKDADKLSNDGMDGLSVRRDLAVIKQVTMSTDETPGSPPDVGRPARILLVRHGVTDFTVAGKLDGRGGANPDLNERGRSQAERAARGVAARLARAEGPVHVVTSSLARAIQTGDAVATALGLEPSIDRDWDELAFGAWDGWAMADLIREFPREMAKMRVDDDFSVTDGESSAVLRARVVSALERSVDLAGPGGTVIVATHRKPIMAVLQHVLGLTTESAWRLAAAPASLTGLEVWADGVTSVAFTNDTNHHR